MNDNNTTTPIADGWYMAHPVFADRSQKDETNYTIRIGLKPYQTAPRSGAPTPCPDDIETVWTNLTLVYGAGAMIYDFDTREQRAATQADTQKAITAAARLFPAWAAFCAKTTSNEDRLAWFMEQFEDFAACEVLVKVTHTTKNGATYTNARMYANKESTERTVDRAALAAKYGKAAKAAMKGIDFGALAGPAASAAPAPASAKPAATPAPAPKPTPPPKPAPAPKAEDAPPATLDEAYAEWVKEHPLDKNGEGFYAYAEKVIGNADFDIWTEVEWGKVKADIMPF